MTFFKAIKRIFSSSVYMTIESVLGFDRELDLEVLNENNELVILRGGIRSTALPDSQENMVQISVNSNNVGWFTNYNVDLLNKIKDSKKYQLD